MLKIGVIGLGNISRGVHIPGIKDSPDAVISAVCDIDPARLKQTADELCLPSDRRFSDYRELIACPDVDAVTIPTPNDMHIPIALEAVAAGKPFDVEKPLGLSALQTAPLLDALNVKPVANMINFSYRFIPAARYARDIILSGKLGRIYHLYAQYFQGWGNSDCPRIWRFSHEISGTGTLADLGVHMIDLARFMTGDDYAYITADNGTFIHERRDPGDPGKTLPVDVDDYSHFIAATKGGIAESFEITRFANARGNYQRVEVYGEKGGLVYRLDDGIPLEISINGTDAGYRQLDIPPEYNVGQMQTFIDICLGRGRRLAADVSDGQYAMTILDAIRESGETGRRIYL